MPSDLQVEIFNFHNVRKWDQKNNYFRHFQNVPK